MAVKGVRYFARGLALVTSRGWRRFVLAPFLLNAVLFAGLGAVALRLWSPAIDWMAAHTGEWLRPVLWLIVLVLLGLLTVHAFFWVGTLLGAPFYAVLAERVEARARGRPERQDGLRQLLGDLGYALGQQGRKLVYYALCMLPVLVSFLIPGVQALAPALLFVVSSWLLALEATDYSLSLYRIPWADERRLVQRYPATALGLGATTLLCLSIPVLNFWALPAAVAGATLFCVEELLPDPPPLRS